MNVTPLSGLSDWPSDRIVVPPVTFKRILEALQGKNLRLIDNLVLNADEQACIKKFADSNGFEYTAKQRFTWPSFFNRPAWMYSYTVTNKAPIEVHLITGTVHGMPITLRLHYVPVDTRQTALDTRSEPFTVLRRSIITVLLPTSFPKYIVSSKSMSSSAFETPATKRFTRRIRPTDDPEFNKHYLITTPANLPVAYPDLLSQATKTALLVEHGIDNIEFYGNQFTITTEKPLYTVTVMSMVVRLLDEELPYLKNLAKTTL